MTEAEAVSMQPLPVKTVGTAYLLWFVFGLVGGHQFYLGKVKRGFLYLFTFGLCGLGILWDMFTMREQVRRANAEIRAGIRIG